MSRRASDNLILYDTSNFEEYPIGGQITSIRNFLRYVAECHPDVVSRTLLVGVSLNPNAIGEVSKIRISGQDFRFLPVALAEPDQGHTKSSLRLKYVKGLMRHLPKVDFAKSTINYIHTPEAYGPVRLRGKGSCAIFSHGSFFNMQKGFRFYKDSWISKMFQCYLNWTIKSADRLFVIDDDSYAQYIKQNKNVSFVSNSIDYREQVRRSVNPSAIKLLFVGRLSAVKNIGPIIEAAESLPEIASLAVVGEGEEGDNLRAMAGPKTIFTGALGKNAVRDQMRASDILVMNSNFEGVPMSILEAMGMGLPIVSTDVGGVSQVVSFGENAEKTIGTSNSIALAVTKIMKNYYYYSNNSFEYSKKYMYQEINKSIFESLLKMSK